MNDDEFSAGRQVHWLLCHPGMRWVRWWFPLPYSQIIVGEQLVPGRYAVAGGRFEPAALWLQGTEHTAIPPRPNNREYYRDYLLGYDTDLTLFCVNYFKFYLRWIMCDTYLRTTLCEVTFESNIFLKSPLHTISERQNSLAERGFDPRTSGLWAQHASTAPLCSLITTLPNSQN